MNMTHVGFVVFLVAPAIAQQVWKVNNQGIPGTHFTDLPQAVSAASPGDEIRVYWDPTLPFAQHYTSPIINKPLRILGFSLGQSALLSHVNLRGPLLITNIAQGQRVEISGLVVAGSFSTPTLASSFMALDCQGSVLLESCTLASTMIPSTIRFERCDEVVIRGCEIGLGGSPLTVIDANLMISASSVNYYGPYFWSTTPAYAATTESLRITNSTVTVIWTNVNGSNNYGGWPYQSQPAAVIDSGVLRMGPGGGLWGGFTGSFSYEEAFVVVDPQIGSVQRDGRSTVYPAPSSPPMVPVTLDAVYHGPLIPGQPFQVRVAAPPLGYTLLALGEWLPNTPSPLGPLAMDPNQVFPVGLMQVPATGPQVWNLNCPLGAPVAHAFAFQALTIATNGTLGITLPSPMSVNWLPTVTP